eukprot:1054736-Amorphochlora_amoeboformis.AAC.1
MKRGPVDTAGGAKPKRQKVRTKNIFLRLTHCSICEEFPAKFPSLFVHFRGRSRGVSWVFSAIIPHVPATISHLHSLRRWILRFSRIVTF